MQNVMPAICAAALLPGDVIHFGGDLCFVVGVECVDPYLDDSTVTLVTQGENGSQFVDYVSPFRSFTVVRNV